MSRVSILTLIALTTATLACAAATSTGGPWSGRGRGGPGAPQAPANGRAQAPFDLSGYWVAMVTDDWRYRMLTPPKGNADYIQVNAEARKVMDAWDTAKDEASGEACRGYGAGGIMRLPSRLHITWEDDNTMKMDIDTGRRRDASCSAPRHRRASLRGRGPRRRDGCSLRAPAVVERSGHRLVNFS